MNRATPGGARTPVQPIAQLHNDVLDSLGERIAAGELAAGTVLTLESIAREFGVSRPVAREAIRVLESLGMTTSRRRVGVTVQPQDNWNLFHPAVITWRLRGEDRTNQLLSLSELRSGFEPTAAAMAARRADASHCRALAAAVSDMVVHARTGDLEAYLDADQVFHNTLLAASGNEMFASLAGVVDAVLAGRTRHDLMPAQPNPEAIALHDAVAQAVRDRRAEDAEAAMRAIIDEAAAAMSRDG